MNGGGIRLAAACLALLAGPVIANEAAPPPAENGIGVAATLSTNVIHIGDVVRLQATVSHPVEGRVIWPVLDAGRAVVQRLTQDPPGKQPPGQSSRMWELTSLEVGTHPVWTGHLSFVRGDGTTLEAALPPLSLRVETLLTETNTTPRDIKGLVTWPRKGLRLLALALAVVAGLALLAGLVALLVRRLRRPAPVAPPLPPHERALRALQDLRSRGWIEAENVEPFYVELSAIIRRYIEDRFGVRAPEQTTEEFIRAATTSRLLSLEHQHLVADFLEQSDLVKFARHRPRPADMEAALLAAERLIRETVPPPPPTARAAQPSTVAA